MSNIREQIYLAALIHDIGFFYQKVSPIDIAEKSSLNKKENNKSGPYGQNYTGSTVKFIEDFKPLFSKFIKNDETVVNSIETFCKLASNFYLPETQLSPIEQIIKEAYNLSSGISCESKIESQERENGSQGQRLIPIIETIGLKDNELVNRNWHYLPVKELSISKDSLPKDNFETEPDYVHLWEKFKKELNLISYDDCQLFAETLLNVLHKYASNIPSRTSRIKDVSLYDHLKTTAALSICLYDVKQSGENPKDRFLLIGGDFSGIQSYLYQIVSKYAGKNLKGRSFYIRILSDSIVRYLIKELNLTQANIIYNSGGGFYILAPNIKSINDKLGNAIQHIEKQVFAMHGTSLYVAIDSVPLSDNALMHKNGENIGDVWGKLFLKRDKRKNQRYATMMQEEYQKFFVPQSGKREFDCISGEEIPSSEQSYKEGELSPLRLITKKQIALGKKLRDFDVIIITETEIPKVNKDSAIEFAGFGVHYYLLKREEIRQMKENLRQIKSPITLLYTNGENDESDLKKKLNIPNIIYGQFFYGGNKIQGKSIPTFEELCKKHDNDSAFQRLGVLRMDVDNLGKIFQGGISPERATLSRYSALSRSMDYFFSGYLNTIWQEVAPEQSIIIYSGGDDVFIVGSWEQTIAIAKRIKEDFRKFSCGNPNFSISGGIALLSAKYPIMKGAEESANEEQRAKHHRIEKDEKNAISFLNTAMNWDNEFPVVEELKNKIMELHITDAIKSSFISKVLLHRMNANICSHKITNFKTYWMVAYDMSRMEQRTQNIQAKELIKQFVKDVCGNMSQLNGKRINTSYHPIELWALACRWAELELRTNNNK